MRRLVTPLALLAMIGAAPAAAQDMIAQPVLDDAAVWSDLFEAELRGTIATIEARSGLEFAFVSVSSLGGRDSDVVAEDYVTQLRNALSGTPAGKQGVAVLLLAPNEREFTFHMNAPSVAERLAAISDPQAAAAFVELPDPSAFSEDVKLSLPGAVVPFFGKDDWEGGARAALAAILDVISAHSPTTGGETP